MELLFYVFHMLIEMMEYYRYFCINIINYIYIDMVDSRWWFPSSHTKHIIHIYFFPDQFKKLHGVGIGMNADFFLLNNSNNSKEHLESPVAIGLPRPSVVSFWCWTIFSDEDQKNFLQVGDIHDSEIFGDWGINHQFSTMKIW